LRFAFMVDVYALRIFFVPLKPNSWSRAEARFVEPLTDISAEKSR
jgi:hypothetical protein